MQHPQIDKVRKMKRKYIIFFLVGMILLVGVVLSMSIYTNGKPNPTNDGYWPENGVVSNENTAIKIAEVVWQSIYGDKIYSKQPFIAEYNKDKGYWYVHGTLSPNTLGGVPEIKINKYDGKILYISHGK